MALQTFVGHEVVECINKSKSGGGRKKGKKNRVKKLHWNVYRISAFQFDVGFAHRCHTHNFHWVNISWPFIQSTLQSRTQCYLRKHSHNILNCFFFVLAVNRQQERYCFTIFKWSFCRGLRVLCFHGSTWCTLTWKK